MNTLTAHDIDEALVIAFLFTQPSLITQDGLDYVAELHDYEDAQFPTVQIRTYREHINMFSGISAPPCVRIGMRSRDVDYARFAPTDTEMFIGLTGIDTDNSDLAAIEKAKITIVEAKAWHEYLVQNTAKWGEELMQLIQARTAAVSA